MAANNADAVIDPRLTGLQTQPRTQPLAPSSLPSHTVEIDEEESNEDGNEEKRRKLNLWKCNHCRDARKKCLPEGRVWPQKCDRCLQHRPAELECSKPQLNTRKRGKNAAKRSKTGSTPDVPDSQETGADSASAQDSKYSINTMPATNTSGRPTRQPVTRNIKKEQSRFSKAIPDIRRHHPLAEDYPPSAYLDLKEGEFRVLLLEPSCKGEKVSYSFITKSITESFEYEAISYLWGGSDEKASDMAEMRDSHGKSHFMPTRKTLYTALRYLRGTQDVKAFWVDALCINRSHDEETNRQVAMKRSIFHNATNLCLWLGEDQSQKAALEFITNILKLEEIDKLVKIDHSTGVDYLQVVDGWGAFVALLKNPVFSRLWIFQEVAVAQNVTVHCGDAKHSRHYGDLVEAVAVFVSFRAEISTLFRQYSKNCKELTDPKMTIAERFMDISSNALRVSASGKVQRLLSLERLVSQLSDLSAGNHRDRIFAVLALAKDGPRLVDETLTYDPQDEGALKIDYKKSILEVYQDFVEHAITQESKLDIICRHWASSVRDDEARLPTWVRPYQSFFPAPFENSPDRAAADSLVGLPDHTYYHASRGKTASFQILLQSTANGDLSDITDSTADDAEYLKTAKLLAVKGCRLDTILKLAPRASEGIIQREWLEMGGCSMVTMDDVPEDFWRTLVADRSPTGTNAPPWYRRAFLYCLQHLTPTRDLNTNRLIDESEEPSISSLVVDFLQRVQSVIWNRKLLVSKKQDWLGLAPWAAEVEDVICVLYGCSVPVVLRPVGREVSDREGEGGRGRQYRLIGECYVHGMMDGEAVEGGEFEEMEFELI